MRLWPKSGGKTENGEKREDEGREGEVRVFA
jgi:hypothetical protein